MVMFVNFLINAVVQILLFTLIPFLWWLVTARKKMRFFEWLGLKAPGTDRKQLVLWSVVALVVCFVLGELCLLVRGDVEAADSAFRGLGIGALPSVLVYAFLQTGLSEEILFRGFLLKRLSARFGFFPANVIQAVIFGAVHLLMIWGKVGLVAGIVICVYPMIPAVAMAFINEKKANGSILPSWLIHGSINTLSTLLVLFG